MIIRNTSIDNIDKINAILNTSKLSLTSKGLLLYILEKNDSYDLSIHDLAVETNTKSITIEKCIDDKNNYNDLVLETYCEIENIIYEAFVDFMICESNYIAELIDNVYINDNFYFGIAKGVNIIILVIFAFYYILYFFRFLFSHISFVYNNWYFKFF